MKSTNHAGLVLAFVVIGTGCGSSANAHRAEQPKKSTPPTAARRCAGTRVPPPAAAFGVATTLKLDALQSVAVAMTNTTSDSLIVSGLESGSGLQATDGAVTISHRGVATNLHSPRTLASHEVIHVRLPIALEDDCDHPDVTRPYGRLREGDYAFRFKFGIGMIDTISAPIRLHVNQDGTVRTAT